MPPMLFDGVIETNSVVGATEVSMPFFIDRFRFGMHDINLPKMLSQRIGQTA
jgi:hypothetical protein